LSKITLSKALKLIENFRSHHFDKKYYINHFVENHFAKSQKMIKRQLVDHFVKTTYGIFYLWHPNPKACRGAPDMLGDERTELGGLGSVR
jgi:hypothetical protein